MKKICLIFSILLTSQISLASLAEISFFDLDKEFCPTPSLLKDKSLACRKLPSELLRAKADKKNPVTNEEIFRMFNFGLPGPVEIGIMADAGTMLKYSNTYKLYTDKLVGFISFEGYVNAEQNIFYKFTIIYNVKGEVLRVILQ